MSPWPKRLLVGAMATWTVLTLAAGWYALRGTSADASADASGETSVAASAVSQAATHATATATRLDTVTSVAGTTAEAMAADATSTGAESGGRAQRATPRSGYRRQPVPEYAQPVGAGARTDSVSVDGPSGAPRPVSTARAVIVLDPGHGRGDPGAVHYWEDGTYYTESESNQANAELIKARLVEKGYEVYLTRTGEGRGPGGPLPLQFITSDLYARVQLAKAVDADLYLAIHGNGATVKTISGPETWYCGKHEEGEANAELARRVQRAMMDALRDYGYGPPDRGIKEDAASHHSGDFCQFVVTRESPVPAALLEFLFLSNADDARVLADPRSHELMADYVAAALDVFMTERGY